MAKVVAGTVHPVPNLLDVKRALSDDILTYELLYQADLRLQVAEFT